MSETIIRRMSEVELQEVQWLWKPYIPFGKLVIIQGDPGEGKTTFALRLAAACSSGVALPGMETTEPFNVVYQTAEDGLGDTIKPRLIEAGADENMVLNIIEDTDPLSLSDERIEKAIIETGARLMILDPIQGYIGEDVDINRANEIRTVLKKVAAVADRTGCAIVMVGHLNKVKGASSQYRGLGSIDFRAAARSVLLVGRLRKEPKVNVSETTYEGYKLMIQSRMVPFFRECGNLKVKDITGDEINDYYIRIRNDGLKGTTAQRHHALLHLAFKSAVKRRIIQSNPVEQADRPKAQQYIGKYYNAGELKELLDKTANDPIHIVIFLAAYYGLRRSEVLGLKWSAVDFENKTVSVNHKVVQNDKGVVGMDVMKTKSSYRTLPLIPQVEEVLLAEKEKQEEMMRVMRRGYCKKYTDYICVDAIGEIIKPNYVTDHFKVVLKEKGLKPVRFHDLRHSCASLLLANGVPMKMIQDWLGHSDMGTTANIYSHIDSESKKASAMAIGSASRYLDYRVYSLNA